MFKNTDSTVHNKKGWRNDPHPAQRLNVNVALGAEPKIIDRGPLKRWDD